MIEIRILERKVPRPGGIDDGMYQPPLPDFVYVDVLQYRDVIERFEDGSAKTATPWIDVPRVREKEADPASNGAGP